MEVLNLPCDGRNILMMDYEKDLFEMKYPNEYLIEISMFSGKTNKTKKLLYSKIIERLSSSLGIKK
ncbi:hypothetical protein ALNOE001_04930 [Candidatus Methanobinarius endosymbioticus]|uniref:Uncharacterized protein n=1 Tax=Candidatus Methanobinarius endosymbioticus TaxID=2006182 RepID=A0A366MD02_9EURY|nr:hypothetical protein ALNOE001_04930 [Candidatus Methanobinarius endosymbioticus]